MKKSIQIGLLGLGTVGTGVARMLMENKDVLEARVGVPLKLKYIADIDLERDRGLQLDASMLTTDAFQVVDDPDVDIVVEMIGGEGIARSLDSEGPRKWKAGCHRQQGASGQAWQPVVQKGMESGVDLAYEASVGGCMPIIKTVAGIAGGQPYSVHDRHFERYLQLHPVQDYRRGHRIRCRPGQGQGQRVCRGRSDPGCGRV